MKKNIQRTNSSSLKSEFDNHDDEELLEYMVLRNEDPALSMEAYGEFYKRHVNYLYNVCLRKHFDYIGEEKVMDLVQNTFKQAFEKAKTYKPIKDKGTDRMQVRAWLGKIAENIYIDAIRNENKIRYVRLSDEQWENQPEITKTQPLSPSQELLLKTIEDCLSERELEVLRLTADFYKPESKNQYTQRGEIEGLAKRFQTTSENIRQIRSRARKKVEKCLQVLNNNP